jgi:hypothetical protein
LQVFFDSWCGAWGGSKVARDSDGYLECLQVGMVPSESLRKFGLMVAFLL